MENDDFSNYKTFGYQILSYDSKTRQYTLFDRSAKKTVVKSKEEYWKLLDEFKKKKQ